MTKSPFYIDQNFISPKLCEQIVNDIDFGDAPRDANNNALKISKQNAKSEQIILQRFQSLVPILEKHYEYKHHSISPVVFEKHVAGVINEPKCESCSWLRNNWVRTSSRDITCVLFLTDYQDQGNFDSTFEVYGGKFEFPQYNFGFHSKRSTLIAFPSGPHFINTISQIQAGSLMFAKWHITSHLPYLYNPENFKGNYKKWFKDFK